MFRLSILFLLISFHANSQFRTPTLGPETDVAYKNLGSLKNCIGIIGDEYLLLENSFGKALDFNNNIITYISSFSVNTGILMHRINLNEILSTSGKEANSILVNDVFVWKDKLIAFYTYKNPGGKYFQVDATLLDTKGSIIRKTENIGVIKHSNQTGSFLGQGGLIFNGRNTLSVANEFRYKMSPDSSKLIVYTIPEKPEDNIRLLIYNEDFSLLDDVSLAIPLREKEANLVDFEIDINGNLLFLIRTSKSKTTLKTETDGGYHYMDLLIWSSADRKLKSIPVKVDQKVINTANLLVTRDEVICHGTYSMPEKKNWGSSKGVFLINVNVEDPLESTLTNLDFTDETIIAFNESFKKKERVDGIPYTFGFYEFLPDGLGGLFLILSYETLDVVVKGNTGALNKYIEATRAYLLTHIGKDRKISWVSAFGDMAANIEHFARLNRPLFYEKNGQLFFVETYDWSTKEKITVLRIIKFNEKTGEYEHVGNEEYFKLPISLREYETLEKSMIRCRENEFILTLFHGKIVLVRLAF